jgi:GDP-L-fucose synthase
VNGVKKLLFLGSSCIYPRDCPQPMKEEYLLTGPLEPTNEPYAIAKIAGIKMCSSYNSQYGTSYISVMPTNLYGPGDNYNLETSHVLPALFRKITIGKYLENKNWNAIRSNLDKDPIEEVDGTSHEDEILYVLNKYGICIKNSLTANDPTPKIEIKIWGTGKPLREFLHVDDLADACFFLLASAKISKNSFNECLLNNYLNIGSGEEISIAELAKLLKKIIGFGGDLKFDSSKPDGTPRKLLDSTKLEKLGWTTNITLNKGMRQLYIDN